MAKDSNETTLFEDLERITNEQEQEDLQVLEESEEDYTEPTEDEMIANHQTLFIDDGKLDYDIKFPIQFKVGEIAKHFNLKEEELDRFSEIYEEMYRDLFSLAVYQKSLNDQIKQKGNLLDFTRASSLCEGTLNKLWELKMLKFFCNMVKLDDKTVEQITEKEIERLFTKPVINVSKPENTEANSGVHAILKKLKKAGL